MIRTLLPASGKFWKNPSEINAGVNNCGYRVCARLILINKFENEIKPVYGYLAKYNRLLTTNFKIKRHLTSVPPQNETK